MAQRTIVQLVSDLSGDEVAHGKGETIEFAYRGSSYTIDLTDKEAAGFDKSIAMYLEHATKIGGRGRVGRKRSSVRSSSGDNKAIREWANANGYDIGDRGRIPAHVRNAYQAAN